MITASHARRALPLGAVMIAACGGGGATTSAEPTTYLVEDLSLGLPEVIAGTLDSRIAGVDLDGIDSPGGGTSCVDRIADYVSMVDQSERGVDNAVGGLAFTSLNQLGMIVPSSQLLAAGELRLAIRVRAEHAGDGPVLVDVGEARPVDCESGDACAPALDGVQLELDQAVVFVPWAEALPAEVRAGRLIGELGDIEIPSGIIGGRAPERITLRDASIDAELGDAHLAGVLGGAFAVDDLVRLARALDPATSEADAREAFADAADIDPSADPRTCASLSAGLTIASVRAQPE